MFLILLIGCSRLLVGIAVTGTLTAVTTDTSCVNYETVNNIWCNAISLPVIILIFYNMIFTSVSNDDKSLLSSITHFIFTQIARVQVRRGVTKNYNKIQSILNVFFFCLCASIRQHISCLHIFSSQQMPFLRNHCFITYFCFIAYFEEPLTIWYIVREHWPVFKNKFCVRYK